MGECWFGTFGVWSGRVTGSPLTTAFMTNPDLSSHAAAGSHSYPPKDMTAVADAEAWGSPLQQQASEVGVSAGVRLAFAGKNIPYGTMRPAC